MNHRSKIGFILALCFVFNIGGTLPVQAQIIKSRQKTYELIVQKSGFKYLFRKNGNTIAGFHPVSGLRFSSNNDTILYDAVTTELITQQPHLWQLSVANSKGAKASVTIQLFDEYLNFKIIPETGTNSQSGNFIIDIRTTPLLPAYGLGDHGGYGNSTNVFGFDNNHFLNTLDGQRFISSFSIFPAQGMAQVIFEKGHKRIAINQTENKMGAAKVAGVNAYYFFGSPAVIYKNYAHVKRQEGYPDLKPKYDFFELGYEAFGSLGWNTFQASVQKDIETYLQKGYHLKWAVVGSGFWKGDRKNPEEGNTNSFGVWDDTAEPGRKDSLPNPRYPDVAAFKAFFKQHNIHLLVGLRTNFKAPKTEGGFYNPVNNGPYPLQGIQNHYFIEDNQQKPIPYKVHFPQGNIYILNPDNPAAVHWFAEGYRKWGVKGYKEDMMLQDGPKLNNDAKQNKVNEQLMREGNLVMVRNSAFSVPGDILRLEDTKYGLDQDRPLINLLNYAASGAPNVYPDIVAGKYLPAQLTDDHKLYFVRNAMTAAVCPAMSVGLGPWHLQNPEYEAVVKKATDWHNKLAPYIYSAVVESFTTGYPHTVTPLPIAFPNDVNTYNLANKQKKQYSWMLGPSLLAVPAYGSDYATVQKRDVYLPEGKWQDWETGIVYQGPVTLPAYDFPITKIPVFIGGKGIIVTKEKEGLRATVYSVGPAGSTYIFTYPDGVSQSFINSKNKGWNPKSLEITDTHTGKPVPFTYHEKHRTFSFPIVANHHYELGGGN